MLPDGNTIAGSTGKVNAGGIFMTSEAQIQITQIAEDSKNAEASTFASPDAIIVEQQAEIDALKIEVDGLTIQNTQLMEKIEKIQDETKKLSGLFEAWQEKLDTTLQIVENHLTNASALIDGISIFLVAFGILTTVLVTVGIYVFSKKKVDILEDARKEIVGKIAKEFS